MSFRIVLDPETLARVFVMADIDLQDGENAFADFRPGHSLKVIWAIICPQAQKEGISPEDFADGLVHPTDPRKTGIIVGIAMGALFLEISRLVPLHERHDFLQRVLAEDGLAHAEGNAVLEYLAAQHRDAAGTSKRPNR
jgi:hypothetical protein